MDPVTLMIASTVVSAVGAIAQGQAASDAANHNAALADRNAQIARSNTESDLIDQRRTSTKALGGMRAAYSASGVSLEGSPLDVLAESVSQSELERQNIKYGGRLKEMGFQSDADLYRANASNAKSTGYMNAASTALSGMAKSKVYGSGSLNRAPVSDMSTGYGVGD